MATLIKAEEDDICELCDKVAELRPYGPNGERVCFECGMKNRKAAEQAFDKRLNGGGTVSQPPVVVVKVLACTMAAKLEPIEWHELPELRREYYMRVATIVRDAILAAPVTPVSGNGPEPLRKVAEGRIESAKEYRKRMSAKAGIAPKGESK